MTPALRARLVCAVALLWFGWVLAHAYVFDPQWQVQLTDGRGLGLTFWHEAVARAGRACAGAALVWLAAWQLGRHLGRWCIPFTESGTGRAQFTLALGALALSEALLASAVVGAYRPAVVVTVMVACAASRPRGLLADARSAIAYLRQHAWAGGVALRAIWWIPATLGCGFALVAALAPEIEYDALWYHLWLPVQWLSAGRLIDIVQEYPSLYPGAWELLNGGAIATGGPVAAKLLHFGCAPLAAAAACLVAREVAPAAPRTLVAALVLTAPTILWEASTAYVDLALTWFTTLAVAAAFRYHRTDDRRWAGISALMVGAAMGVKHLGLIALAVLVAALLVREVRRRDVRRTAAGLVLFVSIALFIPAPWYVRAYVRSGNPVFPEMYSLFGARPATRWSPGAEGVLSRFKASFGMGRTPGSLARLPWNITVHGARFGGTLGPLFLLLAPFALFARDRRRLAVLAAGAAVYAAVWASPLGSFQLRLLLPIVPCVAVLAAAGAGTIVESARRSIGSWTAPAVRGLVLMLLLLNLPPLMDWHDTERHVWDGWLTHVLRGVPLAVVLGGESGDDYLARSVPTYRAWRAIDARTGPETRVLTFAGGDQLYSHRARLWSDSTIATPITQGAPAGDERTMLAAARKAGITHVLFDKREVDVPRFKALAIASAATRAHAFAPFYEDERIEVVRLVYPDPPLPPSAPSDR